MLFGTADDKAVDNGRESGLQLCDVDSECYSYCDVNWRVESFSVRQAKATLAVRRGNGISFG